uniref:Neurabin-1 n=1 Tax=Cacopsylla melanoneura TaxID=428564 RepID=A0A8D9BII6_9HEMI
MDGYNSANNSAVGPGPESRQNSLNSSVNESFNSSIHSNADSLKQLLRESEAKMEKAQYDVKNLQARLEELEESGANKEEYAEKLRQSGLKLREVERSLYAARKEAATYQEMLQQSQGQYTMLEKKYTKAKRLIREFTQREADLLHREEFYQQLLQEKDMEYNSLVKALKDRVIQIEQELVDTQKRAGLPVRLPFDPTSLKLATPTSALASRQTAPPVRPLLESLGAELSDADESFEESLYGQHHMDSNQKSSTVERKMPPPGSQSKDLPHQASEELDSAVPPHELLDSSLSRGKADLAARGRSLPSSVVKKQAGGTASGSMSNSSSGYSLNDSFDTSESGGDENGGGDGSNADTSSTRSGAWPIPNGGGGAKGGGEGLSSSLDSDRRLYGGDYNMETGGGSVHSLQSNPDPWVYQKSVSRPSGPAASLAEQLKQVLAERERRYSGSGPTDTAAPPGALAGPASLDSSLNSINLAEEVKAAVNEANARVKRAAVNWPAPGSGQGLASSPSSLSSAARHLSLVSGSPNSSTNTKDASQPPTVPAKQKSGKSTNDSSQPNFRTVENVGNEVKSNNNAQSYTAGPGSNKNENTLSKSNITSKATPPKSTNTNPPVPPVIEKYGINPDTLAKVNEVICAISKLNGIKTTTGVVGNKLNEENAIVNSSGNSKSPNTNTNTKTNTNNKINTSTKSWRHVTEHNTVTNSKRTGGSEQNSVANSSESQMNEQMAVQKPIVNLIKEQNVTKNNLATLSKVQNAMRNKPGNDNQLEQKSKRNSVISEETNKEMNELKPMESETSHVARPSDRKESNNQTDSSQTNPGTKVTNVLNPLVKKQPKNSDIKNTNSECKLSNVDLYENNNDKHKNKVNNIDKENKAGDEKGKKKKTKNNSKENKKQAKNVQNAKENNENLEKEKIKDLNDSRNNIKSKSRSLSDMLNRIGKSKSDRNLSKIKSTTSIDNIDLGKSEHHLHLRNNENETVDDTATRTNGNESIRGETSQSRDKTGTDEKEHGGGGNLKKSKSEDLFGGSASNLVKLFNEFKLLKKKKRKRWDVPNESTEQSSGGNQCTRIRRKQSVTRELRKEQDENGRERNIEGKIEEVENGNDECKDTRKNRRTAGKTTDELMEKSTRDLKLVDDIETKIKDIDNKRMNPGDGKSILDIEKDKAENNTSDIVVKPKETNNEALKETVKETDENSSKDMNRVNKNQLLKERKDYGKSRQSYSTVIEKLVDDESSEEIENDQNKNNTIKRKPNDCVIDYNKPIDDAIDANKPFDCAINEKKPIDSTINDEKSMNKLQRNLKQTNEQPNQVDSVIADNKQNSPSACSIYDSKPTNNCTSNQVKTNMETSNEVEKTKEPTNSSKNPFDDHQDDDGAEFEMVHQEDVVDDLTDEDCGFDSGFHAKLIGQLGHSASSTLTAQDSGDVWSPPNPQDSSPFLTNKKETSYHWQNVPVPEWSKEQVCQWLMALGLEAYIAKFHEAHINGISLLQLESRDFKALGVQGEDKNRLKRKLKDLKVQVEKEKRFVEKEKREKEKLMKKAEKLAEKASKRK